MAFCDNRLWLLSHIHNSFVSSDDTGVCEIVLSPETFAEDMIHVAKTNNLEIFLPEILSGQEEVDSFRVHSPDLKVTSRSRTDTAAIKRNLKLMRGDGEQAKIVNWKSPTKETQSEEELFPRKSLPKKTVNMVSKFSQQLALETIGDNPWKEYGVFEGVPSKDAGSKYVEVFPILEGTRPEQPISIWCGRDAKVKDVIGLTCLKYFHLGRPHKLHPPANNYDLFMCEEDGVVDNDFPSLDIGEPFNKYNFQQLALMKKEENLLNAPQRVTLFLTDGTFTEVEVDRGIKFGELLEIGLQRRARNLPRDRVGFTYHLESYSEPGVSLDPCGSVTSSSGSEFYIVRDNSKRVSTQRDQSLPEKPVSFLDAPLFQSFNVQILSKVRTKIDIHLGISGEKVEIDPQQQQPTWSVYKQKACSYDMDSVVSCEVVDKQGTEEREVFKLIYLTDSGWRWTEFEGEKETVGAVIAKINHLIETRQSHARKLRKEYLENKEKKKSKRLSIK